MTFEQWLAANGYDAEALNKPENAKQKKHLEAAWKAETQPPPIAPPVPPAGPTAGASDFDQKMAALEANALRCEHIRKETLRYAEANKGNPEKVKQLKALGAAAEADEKMSTRDFDLAMLRAERQIGIMVVAPRQEEATNDVLEAAICVTHRLPGVEKRFSAQTLDAAHKRFRSGLTLMGLVSLAARQNGYRGDLGGQGNMLAMWQAATRGGRDQPAELLAASGLSTIAIPGILGNTANKFMAAGYGFGEQAWRDICKIRTANDFKTMTTYRLDGSLKFKKVPPGGELKHGTLSEASWTNIVDTYGIILGIDRRDFINDDLSALTGRSQEIGRGAIDALNEVVWTEWLDDSTFFPTDKSNNNYDDGATDSVLSLAGLDNADAIFGIQTKPDGTPLGVMPKILFVPRALRSTANTLMAAALVVGQGKDAATVPDKNPWADMFKVVSSVYLQSSAITGNSSTAWYLLADPNDISAIELAFLFGRDTPTIEESELPFDRLGMSMRAYLDFGANKSDYRAGVKLKGAA